MSNFTRWFVAFLVYLPTLVLVPQAFVYLGISLVGLLKWLGDVQAKKINKDDLFYIFFLAVSFLVYFVGKPYALTDNNKSINDLVPYTLFIITTIKFSEILDHKIVKIILFMIIGETLLAILQYILGIPYFIKPSAVGMQAFGESEYLYYNKVYGLSAVTSIFAMKIFVGVLLNYYCQTSKTIRRLFFAILIAGLIATFNRTAMVSSILFFLIVLGANIRHGNIRLKIATFFGLIALGVFVFLNLEVLENQFFRGKEVDMSGRDMVFPYYFNFIIEHRLFGNFFSKHWAELQLDRVYHAHNSFLQTFTNMGLLFGCVLMGFLLRKINRLNYLYVTPILVYSMFQYGILWGVSFLDILFFFFLLNVGKQFKMDRDQISSSKELA